VSSFLWSRGAWWCPGWRRWRVSPPTWKNREDERARHNKNANFTVKLCICFAFARCPIYKKTSKNSTFFSHRVVYIGKCTPTPLPAPRHLGGGLCQPMSLEGNNVKGVEEKEKNVEENKIKER
jgi:hypothetical protein